MLKNIELEKSDEITNCEIFNTELPINLINLLHNNEYCILKFYAKWCNPCKRLESDINKLKDSYNIKESILINIDRDVHKDIFENIGISKMPTIYFIKNKEIIKNYQSSKISDFIENLSEILEIKVEKKEEIKIIDDF